MPFHRVVWYLTDSNSSNSFERMFHWADDFAKDLRDPNARCLLGCEKNYVVLNSDVSSTDLVGAANLTPGLLNLFLK